eukprot:TRINITY_DN2584_c1_g1_i1.p1 TRINITY_DN2584_c1_g1~~TRINITY_DN2584_c1_g1_i1.p1  ORF type:complete len:212 (-),score=41.19 TRINITY_DN2584_c1_g1_i1:159-716(-)
MSTVDEANALIAAMDGSKLDGKRLTARLSRRGGPRAQTPGAYLGSRRERYPVSPPPMLPSRYGGYARYPPPPYMDPYDRYYDRYRYYDYDDPYARHPIDDPLRRSDSRRSVGPAVPPPLDDRRRDYYDPYYPPPPRGHHPSSPPRDLYARDQSREYARGDYPPREYGSRIPESSSTSRRGDSYDI